MHNLGCIPSPHDSRDYPVSALIPMMDYPEEFRQPVLKIKDQGQTGSCVAHALSTIKEYQEYAESGVFTEFSPDFIYQNRADADFQGSGMFPREACARLIDYGVCDYSLMPNVAEYPLHKSLITQIILDNAKPKRIITYARISNIDELKNTIFVKKGALIAIPVYDSFENCPSDGILPLPDTSKEKLYGYHALPLTNYTKTTLIGQNSWNENWGNKGTFEIPLDYPINEMWAITDYVLPSQTGIELTIGSDIAIVNGQQIQMDTAPIIDGNNRTLLPIRFIAENMGKSVTWNGTTQKITIK